MRGNSQVRFLGRERWRRRSLTRLAVVLLAKGGLTMSMKRISMLLVLSLALLADSVGLSSGLFGQVGRQESPAVTQQQQPQGAQVQARRVRITTAAGNVYEGVMVERTPDVITLRLDAGENIRIPTKD